MSNKMTVWSPPSNQQVTSYSPPSTSAGGAIEAWFDRKQLDRDTRRAEAMTRQTNAATALVQSRSNLIEECTTYTRKLYAHREVTSTLAHELAYRNEERAELRRELGHKHHLAYIKREEDVNLATIVLVDSREKLAAHAANCRTNYEIQWALQRAELLKVELDIEERKALLNNSRSTNGGSRPSGDLNTVLALLVEHRKQLAQMNMPTDKIDAELAKHGR